jgi:hypothetical protein
MKMQKEYKNEESGGRLRMRNKLFSFEFHHISTSREQQY